MGHSRPGPTGSKSDPVRYCAESGSHFGAFATLRWAIGAEAAGSSDLRFVVSVLRVLSELERIGDLALRVLKLVPDHQLLAVNPATFDILTTMADHAIDRYREALGAWAVMDLRRATELAASSHASDVCFDRLMAEVLKLEGPDAVRIAVSTCYAGRSSSIGGTAAIIGARLRYLLTGDPNHYVAEVR